MGWIQFNPPNNPIQLGSFHGTHRAWENRRNPRNMCSPRTVPAQDNATHPEGKIWENEWPFWMTSIYHNISTAYPQNATEIIKNPLWNFTIMKCGMDATPSCCLSTRTLPNSRRRKVRSVLPSSWHIITQKIAGDVPELIQTTCVFVRANLLG